MLFPFEQIRSEFTSPEEEARWRAVFGKANVPVSDRVIAIKAEEQRMVQITVFKIRNKGNKRKYYIRCFARVVRARQPLT